MRDPVGRIEFGDTQVSRHLRDASDAVEFLRLDVARALVQSGDLIDFSFESDGSLSAPRVPFVSHPYEWSHAQFLAAARLTLSISERIFPHGFELKDASAWNVIFDGARPRFCDHLSFQRVTEPRWWAFGQFARHFIFPLALARERGLPAYTAFKMTRDGVPPEQARAVIGARRFATRYWPLLLRQTGGNRTAGAASSRRPYHANLYALCRFMLDGFASLERVRSAWSSYVDVRSHYSEPALQRKRERVAAWVERIRPEWVVDLGCNTGEFTALAKASSARVVALDFDHDCVQDVYLAHRGDVSVFPVVVDLDDIAGGRGFGGNEFPGLVTRLARLGDVTLMLAIVHHLAISAGVPYRGIVELAYSTTRRALIVEWIGETDPLVMELCAQRRRSPSQFTLAEQRAAFERRFTVLEEIELPGTARRLALMERR